MSTKGSSSNKRPPSSPPPLSAKRVQLSAAIDSSEVTVPQAPPTPDEPMSPSESPESNDDDGDQVVARKDKGKGKMKYAPPLPSEVWERIFAFYYEDCADGTPVPFPARTVSPPITTFSEESG
jgi:hypothetical protein